MNNNLTVRITTVIIVVIVLAILVYHVNEGELNVESTPEPSSLIPGTSLISVAYPIIKITKNNNNWLDVDIKQAPSINSQLFINNTFMGNVVAYATLEEGKLSLLMDRDIDLESHKFAFLVTTYNSNPQ